MVVWFCYLSRSTKLAFALMLFAATAAADVKHDIVGKWSFAPGPMEGQIEFRADGKLSMTLHRKSMKRSAVGAGTYTWVDDTTLAMDAVVDGIPKKNRVKVGLAGDTLTLTDERGSTETFKRSR